MHERIISDRGHVLTFEGRLPSAHSLLDGQVLLFDYDEDLKAINGLLREPKISPNDFEESLPWKKIVDAKYVLGQSAHARIVFEASLDTSQIQGFGLRVNSLTKIPNNSDRKA